MNVKLLQAYSSVQEFVAFFVKGMPFTARGLSSRRKFFKFPPASNSNTMYFGFLSKETPIKCTILG